MNCERARETLIDALAGPIEPHREAAVERHLAACEACGAEAAGLRETWEALAAVDGGEVPGDRMRVRFRAALGAYEAGLERSLGRRLWRWLDRFATGIAQPRPAARLAMATALLALGIGIGWGLGHTFGGGGEALRLRAEMQSMNRAAALALLAHPSASERLRGVSWSAAGGPDERVLAALVEAVQSDESVSVRLAAVEALAGHLERPQVRSGLVASLEQRPQPHLQLAVTRLLAGDNQGGEELARLLASDLLDPEVRRLLLDESGEI